MKSLRRLAVVGVLLTIGVLGGCAGHAERYAQGLKWHLENEAQKAQLTAQGFPQYSWY